MYDESKAQRVIQFISALKHWQGEFNGRCFQLLPWQEQLIRDVFGTVREDDLTKRQFVEAYIEIPKKNGKTEFCAAIALNMLVNDDEWGAQVYSCAADRQQASLVFDAACSMVRQNPTLSRLIKIIDSRKMMEFKPTNSIWQVLSSEVGTKHGLNVSCCIIDELHAQPNRRLFDVMTQGSGDARRQPLFLYITTAGDKRSGICWDIHQKAIDIKEGRKVDPYFYSVIYSLDQSDDWTNEKNWHKCNPSLGHTISIDAVRRQFQKARNSYADEIAFKQLRLNMWGVSASRWMHMDKWDACRREIRIEDYIGRECYGGLDLSTKQDLTCFALVFPDFIDGEERYAVFPFYWLPEEAAQRRTDIDGVPYREWANDGIFNICEGQVIDYKAVRAFINEMADKFAIKEIAYDRYNADFLVQSLTDDGFTMVPFGQGFISMSAPTKELERLVMEGKLQHDGNPVLRWNADNVVISMDAAGNIKMDKSKSSEKIDGMIATVMGLDRAIRSNAKSPFDIDREEGLLVI